MLHYISKNTINIQLYTFGILTLKGPTGVGLHITLGYLCITQLDHSYALYTFVTFLTQVPLEELHFNNVTIIMHGDKSSSTYLG